MPQPLEARTATITRVAQSATVVTLKAADNNFGWIIVNDGAASTDFLYIKFGSVATTTDYTYKIAQNGTVESGTTGNVIYNGIITGLWTAAGAGGAQVTLLKQV